MKSTLKTGGQKETRLSRGKGRPRFYRIKPIYPAPSMGDA